MVIRLQSAWRSERGPRPTNEDAVGSLLPDDDFLRRRKGALYALADGVGGHQAGEVASDLAIRTVIDEYYAPGSHGRIEPALQRAVQAANLRIYERAQREPQLRTMETTFIGLALTEGYAYIAHVGDSRLYRWRAGRLACLTNDHSEVAELVRMRLVKPERLRDHPRRHTLTRTLGGGLIVRPDFIREPVAAEDRYLLCSDGLWSTLEDIELAAALAGTDPEVACEGLVAGALESGADDNVSAVVVHVVEAASSGEPRDEVHRGRWWPLFARGVKASVP